MKPITHRELYDAIENLLNRRRMIEMDIRMASEEGIDQHLIDEYSRLRRSIDINRRLLKILENTYKIYDENATVSDEIGMAIKSMDLNIRFQERRLEEIREIFAKKR